MNLLEIDSQKAAFRTPGSAEKSVGQAALSEMGNGKVQRLKELVGGAGFRETETELQHGGHRGHRRTQRTARLGENGRRNGENIES